MQHAANAIYNNIAYNTQRIAELQAANANYAVDMDDPDDLFVNGNYATVSADTVGEFEASFVFDTINDDGDPVWIYMHNGKHVAWYDSELQRGYIVAQ